MTGQIQIQFMVLGLWLNHLTKIHTSLTISRHLARKWANTYRSTLTRRRLLGSQETEISSIEHLILLDLLGAPDPLIRSYYADSAWMFDALVAIEERLGDSGAFEYGEDKLMASGSWRSWFVRRNVLGAFGHIGDDHVPFLKEGVSVLHIISEPFPRVWHTLKVIFTLLSSLFLCRRWSFHRMTPVPSTFQQCVGGLCY